jgi:NIMA-interacting peptidyl-prolyl cis-trans isomerase 1
MGWEIRFSNSRRLPYFYNTETLDSTWELPNGMTEDDTLKLPGAQYLQSTHGIAPTASGEIRASHILSKHQGSRRPSSWKQVRVVPVLLHLWDPMLIDQDKITRALPEARAAIQGHINRFQGLSPDDLKRAFAETAATESDCSSARKGGDLGLFGRGMMQKSFEVSFEVLEGPDTWLTNTGRCVRAAARRDEWYRRVGFWSARHSENRMIESLPVYAVEQRSWGWRR